MPHDDNTDQLTELQAEFVKLKADVVWMVYLLEKINTAVEKIEKKIDEI